MALHPRSPIGTIVNAAFKPLVIALLLALAPLALALSADDPPRAPASGQAQAPPPLPERMPRPATGDGSVDSFLEALSSGTSDAAFNVTVGQARILTTKANLTATGKPPALIAIGDPAVIDFTVVTSRQIRVSGLRLGVTDLSITTPDGQTYSFKINVVADLEMLRGQLRSSFPDASLRLGQLRDHVVVEGQARDTAQMARIIETIKAYMTSVQAGQTRRSGGGAGAAPGMAPVPMPMRDGEPGPAPMGVVSPQQAAPNVQTPVVAPQVINLIRVPGCQQVALKVRVAELNRTALREIGADFLAVDSSTGSILGTQIGGAAITASGTLAARKIVGAVTGAPSTHTTVFGIFEKGDFDFFLTALRRNTILKILAEPTLVAMHGHEASFLAGGEFPVPIPQTSTGGAGTSVTVTFKEFGVKLAFKPFIQDGDKIRLTVDPEVSSIDFTLGTVIVPGGTPVPGLNTRKAHTVVEMRQGQTLAIAGLLQLNMDGQTSRIPFMGDLPFIGPFFSNTTGNRIEKELIVLVTPYLVEPMLADQVPHTPGDEVNMPNDLEFYLLNRIESRTGRDARPTTEYDDPCHILRCFMKMENDRARGPHGYCNN